MLISTGVVVEVDVELGNICTIIAFHYFFGLSGGGGLVGVESENQLSTKM